MDADVKRLAARFLEFVHRATKLPCIICDETGTIVLAVDKRRVGTTHAIGARLARGEADELFVTAEEAAADPRMKEGCNVAIDFEGRRLGTFGIAGPLELTRPLALVSSAVIAAWLADARQQAELQRAAASVFEGVRRVSERTAQAGEESKAVVATMTAASREAVAKVEASGAIVRTVQDVAQKSRILSINGSVEASRAGEHGRAFAVVAKEMLALAEDARGAAGQIQSTLSDVERAMGELRGAIERSSGLAKAQAAALAEVKEVVDGLQAAMARLARAGDARG